MHHSITTPRTQTAAQTLVSVHTVPIVALFNPAPNIPVSTHRCHASNAAVVPQVVPIITHFTVVVRNPITTVLNHAPPVASISRQRVPVIAFFNTNMHNVVPT
jgi:hypothetical protein